MKTLYVIVIALTLTACGRAPLVATGDVFIIRNSSNATIAPCRCLPGTNLWAVRPLGSNNINLFVADDSVNPCAESNACVLGNVLHTMQPGDTYQDTTLGANKSITLGDDGILTIPAL